MTWTDVCGGIKISTPLGYLRLMFCNICPVSSTNGDSLTWHSLLFWSQYLNFKRWIPFDLENSAWLIPLSWNCCTSFSMWSLFSVRDILFFPQRSLELFKHKRCSLPKAYILVFFLRLWYLKYIIPYNKVRLTSTKLKNNF